MHDYATVIQPMGSVFFKMDSSRVSGERPATGATINITYVVPKDKAAEVEATFGKHSAWMSKFYADSTEHLISCYFTKAPEFKVPTDPSQGETDNIIFTINEEFTQGESVGRHIGTAKGNDYFPGAYTQETRARASAPPLLCASADRKRVRIPSLQSLARSSTTTPRRCSRWATSTSRSADRMKSRLGEDVTCRSRPARRITRTGRPHSCC